MLLSQAKALSTASRLRGDPAGLDLAQQQAQWVVGRNPFTQSTMYGEGYDWAQQYSVSSSDFVGSLPVGMQSRGVTDLPYWPSQNMYVYKEVWVHSSNRWLWLMADLLPPPDWASEVPTNSYRLIGNVGGGGQVSIELLVRGTGTHRYRLRTENLTPASGVQQITLRDGVPATLRWTARRVESGVPFIVVVEELSLIHI